VLATLTVGGIILKEELHVRDGRRDIIDLSDRQFMGGHIDATRSCKQQSPIPLEADINNQKPDIEVEGV
jgi:hypothetical protein